MSQPQLYQVAVEAPLMQRLTYTSRENCLRGQTVTVPLGKRQARGYVLGAGAELTDREIQLKEITKIDLDWPVLPEPYMKWLEWVADYYVYPLGLVIAQAYPPLDKKTSNRKSQKSPVVPVTTPSSPPELTADQVAVLKNIQKDHDFNVHLVQGVTGSGKTEIYMHLLDTVLKNGQRGLVLVPEISLTPQLIQRFAARFGDSIAVLHSQLTDRERTNQWWSIASGEKKILIGARSALFCPIENLGLIVVDEEHEASFKQDEKLKYNGRDCAIMLAKTLNVPIVLGSATPSLESWANAQSGKYKYHRMPSRVGSRSLPQVEIIDMRELKPGAQPLAAAPVTIPLPFWMSPQLYVKMQATLEKKEQVALFLNRRGVAQTVFCRDCGYAYKCPNCEITLTLHGKKHLVCHYCDYSSMKDDNCPSCKTGEPQPLGMGTEQLESDLRELFPLSRIARADRDEIHSRESLELLIHKMEHGELDILVGTQMIAKGLDFPLLTLVGLVLADVGFNLPDFRATERSFQLITQVSGRAGRHVKDGGQVVIQTYNPEHLALQYALNADFDAFAERELQARGDCHYPPVGKIASLRISGADVRKTETLADRVADRAHQLTQKVDRYNKIQVLGPAPAPLAKLRGKFRFHVLLKSPDSAVLPHFCKQLLGDEKWIPGGTKVQIDIDPLSLL